jgi:PST family polysaccharide transporter
MTATPNVQRRMATGAALMVAMKLTERGLGLVSTLVLARLLVPGDFGLIAMAMVLYAILEVMGSFSFDLALIQNKTAERRHYDTAWSMNVTYGAISALALVVAAAPGAAFFREPRLEDVLYLLAITAFVQGLENIGVVAFRKQLDFRREVAFLLVKKLIAVATTITLAFVLRNYWALAIGALVGRSLGVAISYRLHPFRPRFSFLAWKELWRFSGWLLLNNVLIFAAVRGYDLIIGRIAGARSLGLYSIAYEISNLPTTELVYPVSRAVFPGFSKLAEKLDDLRQSVLQVVSLVALITMPVGIGIALLADPFVRILLGDRWLDAIPLIRLLAIYGVLRAMNAGLGDAYLATGQPRLIALINLPHLVVGWPLMIYLVDAHGVGVAGYALIAAALSVVTLNFLLARRALRITLASLSRCFWRPLLASLAMAVLEYGLLRLRPPPVELSALLLQTSVYVLLGALCFLGVLALLWILSGRPEGAERLVLLFLRGRLPASITRRDV